MRILLIEDHTQLAAPIARELENEHGHRVTQAQGPDQARKILRSERFDVAIIDLLFEHLTRNFDSLRAARRVVPTRGELLITGLSAVQYFRDAVPGGGIVLWTSGEANRRLHLLFAYEDFGIRAYCSKSSGTGKADVLNRAVIAASEGRSEVDPVLNAYLPAGNSRKIGETLLKERAKRAMWRALSLHAHTRAEIAKITGYSEHSIKHKIPSMHDDLIAFDPGLKPGASPLGNVASYASRNWEFFLDEAVRKRYD
jgi:DNA-binding NarL/FixJ family response regulator